VQCGEFMLAIVEIIGPSKLAMEILAYKPDYLPFLSLEDAGGQLRNQVTASLQKGYVKHLSQ
jgi:hypothetical protein